MSPGKRHAGQATELADVQAAFRFTMRACAATVALITTADDDGTWYGLAASSVSSLSMDPPSVLIAINRDSLSHDVIVRRGVFGVNFLRSHQKDIVATFASKTDRAARFEIEGWHSGYHGLPFYEHALANLFCSVERTVEYGTHTVFIGLVNHVLVEDHDPPDPLIWLNGKASRAVLD